MQTLVLYCNGNGEEQQCLISHPESVDIAQGDLSTVIEDFNSAGGVYLIPCHDGVAPIQWTFNVSDGYGQGVPMHYAELA